MRETAPQKERTDGKIIGSGHLENHILPYFSTKRGQGPGGDRHHDHPRIQLRRTRGTVTYRAAVSCPIYILCSLNTIQQDFLDVLYKSLCLIISQIGRIRNK